MLHYHIQQLTLRTARGGRLLPWIGPALRGLVAAHFKEQACRHPPRERAARWAHCAGCPHAQGCAYGQAYEPRSPSEAVRSDASGKQVRFSGQDDATRPLVVAPYFPVPERIEAGFHLPLTLTAVGPAASGSVGPLLQSLNGACSVRSAPTRTTPLGRAGLMPSTRRGLGPDGVGFSVIGEDGGGRFESGQISAADFPPRPDALPGMIPRLGIGLVSPLLLQARGDDGRRRPIERPDFGDLFLAAARTVSGLFSCYDQPLAADFAGLKAAAREVRLIEHCYEPFRQRKWSSRSEQRFPLRGVVGGGVYRDVPLAFLPWLLWGGRLHVGPHRVAGAGGWRLVLE